MISQDSYLVKQSYQYCEQVMKSYSHSYYLGTLAMSKRKRQAIWSIYTWCRYVDDIVDFGTEEKSRILLEKANMELEEIFQGKPSSLGYYALHDTIHKFSLTITPFKDMLKGQRMDLEKKRYKTFPELKQYCYRVAGSVGLMSVRILSTPEHTQADENQKVRGAIALGIANQLTNIIRDIAEDFERGRIYLPLQELAAFGYSEDDLARQIVDDRWKGILQLQIVRARYYYQEAEQQISMLSKDSRKAVLIALNLYRAILNQVEENNYDVFSSRLYVPLTGKVRHIMSCFFAQVA